MAGIRSVVLGPTHNSLVCVGSAVVPGLAEYATEVVFQQGNIHARKFGDAASRDGLGHYCATIFKGRGSHLVVLACNLGPSRPQHVGDIFKNTPNDHRGYVIVDHSLPGSSLATALVSMGEMIQTLTEGGYANHPDKELIASATPLGVLPRAEVA